MRYGSIVGLVLLLGLLWSVPPRAADPPREELADKVDATIKKGVKFFRDKHKGQGTWERHVVLNGVTPGGMSALVTLSLLYAGVPPEDEMMQKALGVMRERKLDAGERVYVVSLQTMVFALANQPQDKQRIQDHVDWLLKARVMRNGKLTGWTYEQANTSADNSNTQYAVLALHEGFLAGAKVEPEVWEQIRKFYLDTMIEDLPRDGKADGWNYRTGESGGPTLTMTTAGVCGLLIAEMNLKASQVKGEPKCDGPDCGQDQEDAAINQALAWIGQKLPGKANQFTTLPHLYYSLYGIERTGRFSGQRFIGEKDWYRLGCEFLVGGQGARQLPDGSIIGIGANDVPEISTAFALLFLAKGRTPVLVSKMVHDPEDDWNRNRSDARNLTNFCSKELFKGVPLAWQVFDARRAGDIDTRLEELTASLLQSPVAYVSGKKAPRFKEGEEKLLRSYLDNGGFLVAEACCGSKDFHDGFVELINKRIFKVGEPKLAKLPPTHPVYTASGKFKTDPNKWPLYGVEMGCKTIVVYSPNGLSCWWDANHAREGKGREAFELGANIVAYATGLEPPRPRLTHMDVVKDERDSNIPRGFLKVAQVEAGVDSKPAPRAMSNLMLEMRKLGMDVTLDTESLGLNADRLTDFRFLYMHGRQEFKFAKQEVDNLRFHLESGGLLLADACCGSKQFDAGFRKMVADLWPDKKLEPIPVKDELYSKKLNGEAITEVKCRREGPDGKPAGGDYRVVEPQLEGIKVNGRWVVVYSRYDVGCALEKHQSTDCLGHDHASAVLLGKAVVLYATRR